MSLRGAPALGKKRKGAPSNSNSKVRSGGVKPSTDVKKKVPSSDINVPRSRLRASDSGYSEATECTAKPSSALISPTRKIGSPSGKFGFPSTQETPRNKRDEEASVSWQATPPTLLIPAARTKGVDKATDDTGQENDISSPRLRGTLKRAFSLGSLENSPSKPLSGKRARTAHWTGRSDLIHMSAAHQTRRPLERNASLPNLRDGRSPPKLNTPSTSPGRRVRASFPDKENTPPIPCPWPLGPRSRDRPPDAVRSNGSNRITTAPSDVRPAITSSALHVLPTPGSAIPTPTRCHTADPYEEDFDIVNDDDLLCSIDLAALVEIASQSDLVRASMLDKENIPPIPGPSSLSRDHPPDASRNSGSNRSTIAPSDTRPAFMPLSLRALPSPGPAIPTPRRCQAADPFEEDFDIFNDDDLCSIDLAALAEITSQSDSAGLPTTEAMRASAAVDPPSNKYVRVIVLEVLGAEYGLPPDSLRRPEKILRLLDEAAQIERWLHLREDWFETDVNVGDYLHIVNGDFDPSLNRCIADNAKTIVILHPDCLVPATQLSGSFDCLRKSILQTRIGGGMDLSPPLVYGKMLHCLFQSCLKENNFSELFIRKEMDTVIAGSIEDLHGIGETEDMAAAHMAQFETMLQDWAKKYIGKVPKPADPRSFRGKSGNESSICISKILDIEEMIWSPTYGVKGNIDASIQIGVRDGSLRPKTLVAPFEFKTGKKTGVMAHRAQTTLYGLMMSERYGVDVTVGLLYYMRASDVVQIPIIADDIRGLMIARNSMAAYLNTKAKLPPVIKNLNSCQRCYALDKCLLYHKAVEAGTSETSGLGSLFDNKTGHLTSKHLEFFEKWERLITMEEGDLTGQRKEIWTLLGPEREKKNRCFSGLRILEQPATPHPGAPYKYRFGRAINNGADPPLSFMSSHISVGDMIVVSTEAGHYALATGFVVDLHPSAVTITVDRPIRGPPRRAKGHDAKVNQSFVGIFDVARNDNGFVGDDTVYRLDKDELTSGMRQVRANLVALFAIDGDEKRRRLIVDLETPTFHPDPDAGVGLEPSLNADQRRAVEMVLGARDYALVLGMPGTGKTTTIAHVISALVSRGKTVLLTAYTHLALDNVLLKFRESGHGFVRLGDPSKIHPGILPHTLGEANVNTVSDLETFYASKQVVATTCLGINHSHLSGRRFDYCIVDEASQLTLPVCIGPLRFADAFVLVGDDYQLPPLVRNAEARDGGLANSLFKRLQEAHPAAVTNLTYQYRMCEDVMALSNALIYNNRLRCGTPEIARASLEMRGWDDVDQMLHPPSIQRRCSLVGRGGCWIKELLDPSRRVVFVNTDMVPAPESRPGDLVQNEVEGTLVAQTVEALIDGGVPEFALGVISPYRSQLKLLGRHLKDRAGVVLHTVDKFQGSDKECVLVSLVRSNANGTVGELLKDWRRMNVAFTRAKKKLLIFGSRETLGGTGLFPEFMKIIDAHGWELTLPPEAHALHDGRDSAKPVTPARVRGAGAPNRAASVRTAKARQLKGTRGGLGILGHVLEG